MNSDLDQIVFNWLRSDDPIAIQMKRDIIRNVMVYHPIFFREPPGILGVLCRLGWLDLIDPQLFEDGTR